MGAPSVTAAVQLADRAPGLSHLQGTERRSQPEEMPCQWVRQGCIVSLSRARWGLSHPAVSSRASYVTPCDFQQSRGERRRKGGERAAKGRRKAAKKKRRCGLTLYSEFIRTGEAPAFQLPVEADRLKR